MLRFSNVDEERFINALKNHLSEKVTPLRTSFRENAVEPVARIEPEAAVARREKAF